MFARFGVEPGRMRIALDDVVLDVLDEGRGTTIVLLHGFLLAKETWNVQSAALARHTRVVRFDLRGLGVSSVPAGPYLMETLAGDLASVLDALEIERAIIAGHSLGGYVALAFYRMFAERCLGLGLVCTHAGADDEPTAAARRTLAARVEAEGIAAVSAAVLPKLFAPDVYARQPQLIERTRVMVERTAPAGAAAMLRGMAARVSSEDLLSEIDVPVTLVAGALDAAIPPDAAQRIACVVRGAQVDTLNCGHLPLFEAAEDVTRSLERLLDRSQRGAAL